LFFPRGSEEEAGDEDGQDAEADAGVEGVALGGEAGGCEGDAGDGVEEEEEDANHDDAAVVSFGARMESGGGHGGGVAQAGGFAGEDLVAFLYPRMGGHEEDEAEQHDGGGDKDADEHQTRERILDRGILHMAPPSPRTIIWMPMAATATKKTARSTATGATGRSLAPRKAPASTPRETGAARAGSRYPRCR